MLDLKSLDPKTLNQRFSPGLRWLAAGVLAAGAGLCVGLVIDLLRHWGDRPNSLFFLAFVGGVGGLAGILATRLFRGDRIARPVEVPPRPFIVRGLGIAVFVFGGLAAIASDTWQEQAEIGLLALTGFAWSLWPRRFLPQGGKHGA